MSKNVYLRTEKDSFDFADNACKDIFDDIYIYLTCRTATALILVYIEKQPHTDLNAI